MIRSSTSVDLIKNSEDRANDCVRVPVAHGSERPSYEVLSSRPNLGDFFDALIADASFGYDCRERRAEYMNIKLTEDERRRLRVGPGDAVSGHLRDVFFAGDKS